MARLRRGRRRGGRKSVLVTTWHPRAPNIKEGLKLLVERLYQSNENEEAFPRGSVIAGFRRSRNLGEVIAPTRPRRERRVGEEGAASCATPQGLHTALHQKQASLILENMIFSCPANLYFVF